MSAYWEHTTANRSVITQLVDLSVSVVQAISSSLMEQIAQVFYTCSTASQ